MLISLHDDNDDDAADDEDGTDFTDIFADRWKLELPHRGRVDAAGTGRGLLAKLFLPIARIDQHRHTHSHSS